MRRGEGRGGQWASKRSGRPPWAPPLEDEHASTAAAVAMDTQPGRGCASSPADCLQKPGGGTTKRADDHGGRASHSSRPGGRPNHASSATACSASSHAAGLLPTPLNRAQAKCPSPGDARDPRLWYPQVSHDVKEPDRVYAEDFPPLQPASTSNPQSFGQRGHPPAKWSRNFAALGEQRSSTSSPGTSQNRQASSRGDPPPTLAAVVRSTAPEARAALNSASKAPTTERRGGRRRNNGENRRQNGQGGSSKGGRGSGGRRGKRRAFASRVFENSGETNSSTTDRRPRSVLGTSQAKECSSLKDNDRGFGFRGGTNSQATAARKTESTKQKVGSLTSGSANPEAVQGKTARPATPASHIPMQNSGFPRNDRRQSEFSSAQLGLSGQGVSCLQQAPPPLFSYAQSNTSQGCLTVPAIQPPVQTSCDETAKADWYSGFLWSWPPQHEPLAAPQDAHGRPIDPCEYQRWNSAACNPRSIISPELLPPYPVSDYIQDQSQEDTATSGSMTGQLSYQSWMAYQEQMQNVQYSDGIADGMVGICPGVEQAYAAGMGQSLYVDQQAAAASWCTNQPPAADPGSGLVSSDQSLPRHVFFPGVHYPPSSSTSGAVASDGGGGGVTTSSWAGMASQQEQQSGGGADWDDQSMVASPDLQHSVVDGGAFPDGCYIECCSGGMGGWEQVVYGYLPDGTPCWYYPGPYPPNGGFEAYGAMPFCDQGFPTDVMTVPFGSSMFCTQAAEQGPGSPPCGEESWQQRQYPVPVIVSTPQPSPPARPPSTTWDLSKGLPPEFVPASMRAKVADQGRQQGQCLEKAQMSSLWEDRGSPASPGPQQRWCQLDFRASLQDEDPAITAVVLSPPKDYPPNPPLAAPDPPLPLLGDPWHQAEQPQEWRAEVAPAGRKSAATPRSSTAAGTEEPESDAAHCPPVIEDSIEDLVQYLERLDYGQSRGQGVVKTTAAQAAQQSPRQREDVPEPQPQAAEEGSEKTEVAGQENRTEHVSQGPRLTKPTDKGVRPNLVEVTTESSGVGCCPNSGEEDVVNEPSRDIKDERELDVESVLLEIPSPEGLGGSETLKSDSSLANESIQQVLTLQC